MITNDKFKANTGNISERKFTYQDIKFDLQSEDSPRGKSLHGRDIVNDIKVSYDEGAIMNSLRNIFTTSPGEKVLNPAFGINLSRWLFEPCNDFTAREIGEIILSGLEKFEPRVSVKNVTVIADKPKHMYVIKLVITIPQLNIIDKSYDAILNQPGFDFLTETTL